MDAELRMLADVFVHLGLPTWVVLWVVFLLAVAFTTPLLIPYVAALALAYGTVDETVGAPTAARRA